MAGHGPLSVQLFADLLLEAAKRSLDTLPEADASLRGAPGRRYVHAGVPVHDCEQLVVWAPTVDEASTLRPSEFGMMGAGERGITGRVNFVQLMVSLVRCYVMDTSGTIVLDTPSVAALAQSGKQGNADVWSMWCGINQARREGWFEGTCTAVAFGRAQAIQPLGGVYGWTIPLEFQVEGYKPDIGEKPGT